MIPTTARHLYGIGTWLLIIVVGAIIANLLPEWAVYGFGTFVGGLMMLALIHAGIVRSAA